MKHREMWLREIPISTGSTAKTRKPSISEKRDGYLQMYDDRKRLFPVSTLRNLFGFDYLEPFAEKIGDIGGSDGNTSNNHQAEKTANSRFCERR
jgi:hypothetical protein